MLLNALISKEVHGLGTKGKEKGRTWKERGGRDLRSLERRGKGSGMTNDWLGALRLSAGMVGKCDGDAAPPHYPEIMCLSGGDSWRLRKGTRVLFIKYFLIPPCV